MKRQRFGLETIGAVLAAAGRGALHAFPGRHVEDEGQIGPGVADDDALHRPDRHRIDLAGHALIDAGGVRKAVADHPLALLERGPDQRGEMVVARRGKHHGFGIGSQRPHRARQQDIAHDLGAGRAARLPRQQRVDAEPLDPRRQQGCVRGLAGALAALESDEASAHIPIQTGRVTAACYSRSCSRSYSRSYSLLAAERNTLTTSSVAASKARCGRRPHRNAFGGLQRHFQHLGVAARHLQVADRLPFPHRRPDRSDIDHLRRNALARGARHHQLDLLPGGDRNLALRAAIDLGFGQNLVLGEQDSGVELTEAILQQLLGLVGAVLGVLQPGDDHDKAKPVAGRGGRRGCSRLHW